MLQIHRGSEAFAAIAAAMASEDTYRLSIEERRDGVAIKRNEGTWSPTLYAAPPALDLPWSRRPFDGVRPEDLGL